MKNSIIFLLSWLFFLPVSTVFCLFLPSERAFQMYFAFPDHRESHFKCILPIPTIGKGISSVFCPSRPSGRAFQKFLFININHFKH